MKLTKKEKNILYNFVVGEHNLSVFPNIKNLEDESDCFVVTIKKRLNQINLNNFGGKKEYVKVLESLIEKLK